MTRILVVDDDEGVVDFLSSCLKSEGYEVLTGFSGEEAVKLARSEKPDLLVLDLLMPTMHGFDVCEILKQEESLKAMKILIVSAKAYEVDRKAAERLGADKFLVKPFTAETLLDSVKELVGS